MQDFNINCDGLMITTVNDHCIDVICELKRKGVEPELKLKI